LRHEKRLRFAEGDIYSNNGFVLRNAQILWLQLDAVVCASFLRAKRRPKAGNTKQQTKIK
jgi:hypothetical protein